jgi:hypothetical protein
LEWITAEIANDPEALNQTRRAHDLERARIEALESKSGSTVNLCLTLLATSLALSGYQLAFLRQHGFRHDCWLLLVPAALSIMCVTTAGITALEIQRVGIYQWAGAEPLGYTPGGRLGLVRAEEEGRRLANWSARIKVNAYLQARAWLSRALVAMILSAVVAIGMATRPPTTVVSRPAEHSAITSITK